MKYIVRDKDNKELLVTYSEDDAYKRVNFDLGDTVDEQEEYHIDEDLGD